MDKQRANRPSQDDLLDALQRCVDAIIEYGRTEGEPTPQDEALFDAERIASALLRKARGI